MWRFMYTGLLAVIVTVPPTATHATTMVPLTLKQLTKRSQLVVVGRVVARHSYWTRNRRLILTRVTVSVHRRLKGRARRTSTVVFYHLGGQVGRLVMRVIGAPCFKLGEEVVVFLNRRRNRLFVTGMVQGKFTILRNPRTRRKIVTRNLAGVRWASRRTKVHRRIALTELRARVESATKKKTK